MSFLAVIVAHLAGQLYTHIIAKQGQFSTQMSVSGSSASTGKSLMQTVGMLMFYGEVQPTTTTLTEATFYDMIEDGNIYGKLPLHYSEKLSKPQPDLNYFRLYEMIFKTTFDNYLILNYL